MSLTREVVSRCLALIPLVRENQGITLDELARLARIPREKIAGELGSLLLMCGVPPYFPHDYIGFYLDGDRVRISCADQFPRPISLNPLEALALKLACESVAPPGKGVPRSIASLLSKVEGAMAPEQRRQFRRLSRRVAVQDADESPGGLATRLAMAVAERRSVVLCYASAAATNPKERRVLPYGLFSEEGHWYLVGHDDQRDRILTFRLDRIHRFTLEGERFEIPAGFRLEPYTKEAFQREPPEGAMARIRLSGLQARWVRETAAPGTLEVVDDQTVIWHQPIHSEEALAHYILGFGLGAEVLEPDSLRHRLSTLLGRIGKDHGDSWLEDGPQMPSSAS